jgi:hypothetical protein
VALCHPLCGNFVWSSYPSRKGVLCFSDPGNSVYVVLVWRKLTPYLQFWCWIGQGFSAERLAGQYFWFWLTLFLSFALYLPLLLLFLGVIKEGNSWFSPTKVEPEKEEEYKTNSSIEEGNDHSTHSQTADKPTTEFRSKPAEVWTAIAYALLSLLTAKNLTLGPSYPSVYCLMILPLSIVRWIGFRQEAISGHSHIPPAATFVGGILFALSGVWNTVLYLLTRSLVILGDDDDNAV